MIKLVGYFWGLFKLINHDINCLFSPHSHSPILPFSTSQAALPCYPTSGVTILAITYRNGNVRNHAIPWPLVPHFSKIQGYPARVQIPFLPLQKRLLLGVNSGWPKCDRKWWMLLQGRICKWNSWSYSLNVGMVSESQHHTEEDQTDGWKTTPRRTLSPRRTLQRNSPPLPRPCSFLCGQEYCLQCTGAKRQSCVLEAYMGSTL